MNGGYGSLAEAVGEAAPSALSFSPHVDFDPHDPEEFEIVRLAVENDFHDRMRARVRQLEQQRSFLLEALRASNPDAAEEFEETGRC